MLQGPRRVKTIHVLTGGTNNIQITPFMAAVKELKVRDPLMDLIIVYMPCERIRDNKWTPEQTISWLLEADIHMILCHVHQGLESLKWSMTTLRNELQRLTAHPGFSRLPPFLSLSLSLSFSGFPSGDLLMCPVLLQDKYRYLKLLREMVNSTLRVLLVEEGKFNAAELEQITSFMERNASDSRQEVRTASSFLLSLTTSIVCSSTFSLSLSLSLTHTHVSSSKRVCK